MVERHPDRIPDVGYQEKMERHKGDRPRVHGVGTHLEQLHPDSSSGHAALANITHPNDSISYPDTALAIFTPYSLHSGFAYGMDSKELSSISDCFGDQITNKKHQNLHNLIRNDCKGP